VDAPKSKATRVARASERRVVLRVMARLLFGYIRRRGEEGWVRGGPRVLT
jgi:hypothetical protein